MTNSQASADASCNDRCFGFVADNGRGRPDKSTEGDDEPRAHPWSEEASEEDSERAPKAGVGSIVM
jgi:hypothetical protein